MVHESKALALLSIYASIFSSSIQFTIVYPFASYMVMELGGTSNRSDTGFWVSVLASSIVLARAISSPIFGVLCDNWGRKPVLLIGLLSGIIFPLVFGLSRNLWMAIVVRFMQGLFSPIPVVTKTVLSELCPGEQQAKAMAWLSVVRGISFVIGTIMGGFLSSPGLIDFSLFSHYPFLLPNLVPSVTCLVSFLITSCCLKETLNRDAGLLQKQKRGIVQILKDWNVFLTQSVNFVICLIENTAQEVFTLWCYASKDDGGFELAPYEIGIVLSVSFLLFLPFQLQYYSFLVKRYCLITIGKIHWLARAIVIALIPLASLLRYNDTLRIAILVVCYLGLQFTAFPCLTSVIVLTNNSVHATERGRINGLAMTLGNVARGIGPLIFGNLFAKTAQSGLSFPLNYAFSYECLAIILLASYFVFAMLPNYLNYPKERQSEILELSKV